MELVEGQTLKELIQSQGPLPVSEATRIAEEILAALSHAHQNRIVHRDIKPHNILIARDGRVKVTDFGIARATTTDTVTHTGSIMGSAHYFSPEQANGQPTGEKSDIYSTGIVLYEMVTGGVPFQGESPITVALKHIRERVLPASQLNSEVPAELDQIILRALEKEPEDRFPTADAMREALEQFDVEHAAGRTHMAGDFPTMDLRGMRGRRGRPLAEEAEEEAEEQPERGRRRKSGAWIWITAVAAAVVLLVGGIVWAGVAMLSVPEVDVPNIVGMTSQQALAELKKAQLNVTLMPSQFSDQPFDTVIKTDPAPGTRVKQKREIAITLSKGQNMKPLPDVTNLLLEEAQAKLANEGFKVDPDVPKVMSQTVPAGQVVSMAPAALTPVPAGSTVKLTVSSGPLRVPTLVNLSLTDAKKALQNAGLVVGKIDYVVDASGRKDVVLSSDPASGTAVQPNYPVNLTVAQAPPTGGTPFEKTIQVPGPSTQFFTVRIDLVDVVGGVPNTITVFNEKRQGGAQLTVKGTFQGTAQLRVLVDNKEYNTIPLP
jgi:serine/threonine-protein kinase